MPATARRQWLAFSVGAPSLSKIICLLLMLLVLFEFPAANPASPLVFVTTAISPEDLRDIDVIRKVSRLRQYCVSRSYRFSTFFADDAAVLLKHEQRGYVWSRVLAIRRVLPFEENGVVFVDLRGEISNETIRRILSEAEHIASQRDDVAVSMLGVRSTTTTNRSKVLPFRSRGGALFVRSSQDGRAFLDTWWKFGDVRGLARDMRRRGVVENSASGEVDSALTLAALRWKFRSCSTFSQWGSPGSRANQGAGIEADAACLRAISSSEVHKEEKTGITSQWVLRSEDIGQKSEASCRRIARTCKSLVLRFRTFFEGRGDNDDDDATIETSTDFVALISPQPDSHVSARDTTSVAFAVATTDTVVSRVCISLEGTGDLSVCFDESETEDLIPHSGGENRRSGGGVTTFALHHFERCDQCDVNVCEPTVRFALDVPDVASLSSPPARFLALFSGADRPRRGRFQVAEPVDDWGCGKAKHYWRAETAVWVRDSRSGKIFAVERIEEGGEKKKICNSSRRFDPYDPTPSLYRHVRLRLSDIARYALRRRRTNENVANNFYGRRRMRVTFELAREMEGRGGSVAKIDIDVPVVVSPMRQDGSRTEERDTVSPITSVARCVLVHRGGESFRRALLSWRDGGLLERGTTYIFFQERNEDHGGDSRIAILDALLSKDTRNRTIVLGSPNQVGIASAFVSLIRAAARDGHDAVLFLEEDFRVSTRVTDPEARVGAAIRLINANLVDVVRLRSREDAGDPDCYRVLFESNLAALPEEAHLSASTWLRDPAVSLSVRRCDDGDDDALCADARFAEWSNNPFLARVDFLVRRVVPVAEADADVFGSLANVETPMRRVPELWTSRRYRVAQTDGLFTHEDSDKPLEAQSWPCGAILVERRRASGHEEYGREATR